jgi:hypothetical protein
MIFLVKQAKFKVGVVPADRLACLLEKDIFCNCEWGSLAMSAGANPTIFESI